MHSCSAAWFQRPRPCDEATALKQIVIQGDRSTTSTIGKLPEAYAGGQVAKGGRLGILGNRDFMDAPFSATSYTAQKIEDQGAQTVASVMEADPSVRNTHSSNGMLDSFYIRGFPSARAISARSLSMAFMGSHPIIAS